MAPKASASASSATPARGARVAGGGSASRQSCWRAGETCARVDRTRLPDLWGRSSRECQANEHSHECADAFDRGRPLPARVRFVSFVAYSIDLEIYAYVSTSDWNEFLSVREDLMLRIIDIVQASGTGFAFPSQTLYLGEDDGLDEKRSRAARDPEDPLLPGRGLRRDLGGRLKRRPTRAHQARAKSRAVPAGRLRRPLSG
ncbi:MAG: mechanosensitive ion channel family protein [Deltaproteobacteria bacterium]|nr:MAG: mechanosensitive ion channel family protein [Deltaproteobacteria bacterium]